ncbi:MAG: Bax inhibitor-1/YccA family protein, partial [Luteibaculum sp.]
MDYDKTVNEYNVSLAASRAFFSKVFTYMAGGLAITGALSYLVGTSPELISIMIGESGLNLFGYIVMFAPVILVFVLSARIQKMSPMAAMSTFIIYSALMGLSLSFIFLAYAGETIFTTFLITGGTFACMAILGYTTKTDLSKMGSVLYIALFGIIIAMLVNFFLGSSTLDYIISLAGVAIFTGLTAYDMQRLKEYSYQVDVNDENGSKMAIMGALTLYLDFINLFLFL